VVSAWAHHSLKNPSSVIRQIHQWALEKQNAILRPGISDASLISADGV
jgi:hypothetical protein